MKCPGWGVTGTHEHASERQALIVLLLQVINQALGVLPRRMYFTVEIYLDIS